MTKPNKLMWPPLIIIAAFPYTIIFALACIFGGYFMESIFQSNVYILLICIGIVWLVGFVCAVLLLVLSINKKWDSLRLARINMTIKLIQIPAYLLIFLFGCICLITIFTAGFSVVLFLLDGMAILLSGLVGLAAVKRSHTDGPLSTRAFLIHGLLQFIFCVDVISAIIVFRKNKRNKIQSGNICEVNP